MPACTLCNLCDRPGSFETATDIARVPCHVRAFQNDVFTVWRCITCGSLHSKEDADLPLYYRHYPGKLQKIDLGTRVAYGNRLRMLKRRGLTRESRILDYGCGVGLFVAFLKEHGFHDVVGYDEFVDAYSDKQALTRRYDAVVSYDVIEHVDDPREYLRTLVGLLDVQGLLAIGTPNASEISLATRPFPVELSQPYHRHILSEPMLMQLARELGLHVEHVYRRLYVDSLVPGVNTRFLWAYINARGGLLDSMFEPPELNWSFISQLPKLLFYSHFGYFMPVPGNILVSFRKQVELTGPYAGDTQLRASA